MEVLGMASCGQITPAGCHANMRGRFHRIECWLWLVCWRNDQTTQYPFELSKFDKPCWHHVLYSLLEAGNCFMTLNHKLHKGIQPPQNLMSDMLLFHLKMRRGTPSSSFSRQGYGWSGIQHQHALRRRPHPVSVAWDKGTLWVYVLSFVRNWSAGTVYRFVWQV